MAYSMDSTSTQKYLKYDVTTGETVQIEQNIFQLDQYMYNATDKSLVQVFKVGPLKKSINEFDNDLNYNRTLVTVPIFDQINTT
jgi:hypothetical protein